MNRFLKKRISITRQRDEWYTMTHRETQLWYVYILKCADDSLYTGITTDIKRRLNEHNTKKSGAKYTRGRRPVDLIAYITMPSRSEALKLEWGIKQQNKKDKIKYLLSKGGQINES